MKASEIREMNPDELIEEFESLERKLFEVRTQAVTEKLEDPTQLRKTKKDIARIKTILRERETSGQGAKATEPQSPAEA